MVKPPILPATDPTAGAAWTFIVLSCAAMFGQHKHFGLKEGLFSNVLVESKAFVQTIGLGRKTVPGHFGFEATLLFKHFDFKGRFFVKHFGFKASFITFCFEDPFDLEQDLKAFVKSNWFPSKTFALSF